MTDHPNNDMYRDCAQYLVDHNDNRRNYACEVLGDEDADEPLVVEFAANTKVILDDEGKGAYVTCSIWVPNPNYKDGDEKSEDEDDAS